MWYSSFRSKYKIQPMEKFSGEGSFLFQNDSEPDLWGARFAKQGQVSKSDPFLVLFVLPEAGRPPKFVQRTETLKVGANKFTFFYKFYPEQPESWLESLESVRGSCGLEQERQFAEVGKKSWK